MENLAYEVLSSIGLPTPKLFTIGSALECPQDNNFYLRYRKGMKNLGGLVSYNTFKENKDILYEHVESGDLLQIEETIDTIFGACAYFVNGEIYGEIVNGQLVDILRKGLCDVRFCYNYYKKELLILPSNAFRKNNLSSELNMAINVHINGLIEDLERLNDNFDDFLVEVLLTKDRRVYCDAKKPYMNQYMNMIFKTIINQEIFQKSKLNKLKKLEINEPFDVDVLPLVKSNEFIALQFEKGSLLTHFITRNWNAISEIFIRKIA